MDDEPLDLENGEGVPLRGGGEEAEAAGTQNKFVIQICWLRCE